MSQRHRVIADRMINSAGWRFGTVFRRVREGGSMAELRVDGIAGCLRTPRGGSGRQILVKAVIRFEVGARLAHFPGDLADLVAKKFGAARGRMADAVCVHIKFFQLSGGDFSQRDDLIARK
jgi:hypothetical protein